MATAHPPGAPLQNPTCETQSLDAYTFPTISNGGSGSDWEFVNYFTPGATLGPGETYVLCNPRADAAILANCDQTFRYL